MEGGVMDKQLLTDQIAGLKAAITKGREAERLHIKKATLTEQIEKARVEADELSEQLATVREEKKDLKATKAASMADSCTSIQDRVTTFLPKGEAIFRIEEDGSLYIGMLAHDDAIVTPYMGLSGGEKAAFDLALSNALLDGAGVKILIGEVAELDDEKLKILLLNIEKEHPDAQVLLSTCHKPQGVLPGEWNTVEVG